jgi:osmotically-inducible protein OsmY
MNLWKSMKSATIKPVLGAIAIALLLSTTGCTAMTGETAGQYADDSTITAAVKAKLVADKAANLTRVDVKTTKQVVALNGIVESTDQKARAEQLAKQVNGVRKVDNNLQIQKKN